MAGPDSAAGAPTLGALAALLRLLPIGDIVALVSARPTLDSTIGVAERVAELIGKAFPPAAMTAAEVDMALHALKFVLDLAGVGGAPVGPGYPDIVGEENSPNFKDR